MLSSVPISLGLACSWLLCECYGRKEDTFRSHPGDALLITAAAVATICRALRCAGGAFLLRRVGVDNSWGGLFFVGGFSGFFGSMLVLPHSTLFQFLLFSLTSAWLPLQHLGLEQWRRSRGWLYFATLTQ